MGKFEDVRDYVLSAVHFTTGAVNDDERHVANNRATSTMIVSSADSNSIISRLWRWAWSSKRTRSSKSLSAIPPRPPRATPRPNVWSREQQPRVDEILAALRKSHSDRDIWRVRLQAEDTLLPHEMASLIESSPLLPPPAQKWLGRMDMLGRFTEGEPQRFSVKALAPNVHFYRDPSVARERKRLIVSFCGAGNRLMMATSCVLQYLPSDLCDVVVLRDTTRQHYFKGIPAYANNLPDLIRRIADDTGAEAYERRYCYGTCMGGFPALRGGIMMKADRAISVSGSFPWHPRRLTDEPDNALPAFDPICDCAARTETDLYCAYAAAHIKDQEAATRLSRVRPVNLIALPDLSEHNIIKEQAKKGLLGAFFNDMFELTGTSRKPSRGEKATLM